MLVIADTEMNGLSPTRVWVIVCKNPETQETRVFREEDLDEFREYAKQVTTWVGHYFIKYDVPHLNRLIPGLAIDPYTVLDTCVVSKVLNFGIQGGHGVEAWAERLHLPIRKVPIAQWDVFTEDMIERCVKDVEIQEKIYEHFKRYIAHPAFVDALRLEHDMEIVGRTTHDNGFPFSKGGAEELLAELEGRLLVLDKELQEAFPPKQVLVNEITARGTKHGTIHAVDYRRLVAAGYDKPVAGKTYPIYETQAYNPGSLKETIDRLWEAGWKPTEKTKGHAEATSFRRKRGAEPVSKERLDRYKQYGWKLSNENLLTLPDTAPAATKKLTERLMIAARVGDLQEWLGYCTVDADGVPRIHPNFNMIGAWTHRLSTTEPNIQNIPVPQHVKNPSELEKLSDSLSERMRGLFTAEPGCVLVGTDASGIQMRIFAHYVQDERLIKALIEGKSEDGTDIHTLHWRALGAACKGRNPAKTFIYAWLLGAGVGKVAEILECSHAEAKGAIENFLGFYPGLAELKRTRIPRDAERGYFEGLDGRFVVCNDAHFVLAGYLQNGEAVIMKRAQRIWAAKLDRERVFWKLHTWPHDEWQTSARPDEAAYVGSVQADSIRIAAEELKMNLPFAGETRSGATWAQTH